LIILLSQFQGNFWSCQAKIGLFQSNHLLQRRKIGFIFQFYNLIPVLTAAENAALPLILDGTKLSEARVRAVE
jgi:ABC-type lipoprotein export system ATPase subunit